MSPSTSAAPQVWYRHPWPWALMIVPFASVIVGIIMISTTLIYPDDVVVDTYYKDGQGINQLRALDEMAAALGIQAQLEVAPDNAQNAIHISGTQEPYLSLSLFHVTDSKHDKTLRFEALGNESFVNDDPALTALLSQRGIWYLELRGADNDWRLRQRIVTPIRRLEF